MATSASLCARPFPNNSSNNYGNSYNNSYGNFNKLPSDFENSVKEFMISQKNFNAMIEEKLLKFDDLARNVDRIALDVDSLKLRFIPPKHDINESLKAMRISIDECKERTARMLAKKDCFIKACSFLVSMIIKMKISKLLMCPLLNLFFLQYES